MSDDFWRVVRPGIEAKAWKSLSLRLRSRHLQVHLNRRKGRWNKQAMSLEVLSEF